MILTNINISIYHALFSPAKYVEVDNCLLTTVNYPAKTRRLNIFEGNSSVLLLFPRTCGVDAVSMGASNKELCIP